MFFVVVVPFFAMMPIFQSPLTVGVPESMTMLPTTLACIPGGGFPWRVTFAPRELIMMLAWVPAFIDLHFGVIIRGIEGDVTDAASLAGSVRRLGWLGRTSTRGCGSTLKVTVRLTLSLRFWAVIFMVHRPASTGVPEMRIQPLPAGAIKPGGSRPLTATLGVGDPIADTINEKFFPTIARGTGGHMIDKGCSIMRPFERVINPLQRGGCHLRECLLS
jgi:hypothetical protein